MNRMSEAWGVGMKKLGLCLMMAVLVALGTCMVQFNDAEAKDVWVDHWAEENVDIYMQDDTLKAKATAQDRWFTVFTKSVRGGQIVGYLEWEFYKTPDSMWRYSTNAMDKSHDTVVIPRNKLFEACMEKLNWSYESVDFWYY